MLKTVSANKIGDKTFLMAHAPNDRMFVVICRVEINSNSSRKRPHVTHELISIPDESVECSILLIRSQKVILDRTLAKLYGVSTKALNQAVKFHLTMEEAKGLELIILRSQKLNAPSGRPRTRRCRC